MRSCGRCSYVNIAFFEQFGAEQHGFFRSPCMEDGDSILLDERLFRIVSYLRLNLSYFYELMDFVWSHLVQSRTQTSQDSMGSAGVVNTDVIAALPLEATRAVFLE